MEPNTKTYHPCHIPSSSNHYPSLSIPWERHSNECLPTRPIPREPVRASSHTTPDIVGTTAPMGWKRVWDGNICRECTQPRMLCLLHFPASLRCLTFLRGGPQWSLVWQDIYFRTFLSSAQPTGSSLLKRGVKKFEPLYICDSVRVVQDCRAWRID